MDSEINFKMKTLTLGFLEKAEPRKRDSWLPCSPKLHHGKQQRTQSALLRFALLDFSPALPAFKCMKVSVFRNKSCLFPLSFLLRADKFLEGDFWIASLELQVI